MDSVAKLEAEVVLTSDCHGFRERLIDWGGRRVDDRVDTGTWNKQGILGR